jgi:hypothetical protein
MPKNRFVLTVLASIGAFILLLVILFKIAEATAAVKDVNGELPVGISYFINANSSKPLFMMPTDSSILYDYDSYDGNVFGEREEELIVAAPQERLEEFVSKPLWGQKWTHGNVPVSFRYCHFREEYGKAPIYSKADVYSNVRTWRSDAGQFLIVDLERNMLWYCEYYE